MRKIEIVVLFLTMVLIGCKEYPPVVPDGSSVINIVAIGDTAVVDTIPHFVPMQNAKVILASEYGMMIKSTNELGLLNLTGLPAATYNISVRMPHPLYSNILLVGNIRGVEVSPERIVNDTIFATQVANTGICINEIYSAGPVNNIFYFYDQYIELYNYSDEIKYLDGIIVMRVSGNNDGKGPGADEGDDGDIDGITYIFKFPGDPGQHNYPFYPHTFLVLASTALNHKNYVSTSYDLSAADWEFYNQYSTSDFDNPNVPNLLNLRSDRTVDFLINLVSDVIVVASGEDTIWVDGIDISTIIDGVQYKSGVTSRKTLDPRVDKGYILSPPKYSGRSMRRREPGVDTNDATLDWEMTLAVTPGYH